MYPDDLRYTREHEWVRIEGDVAAIGVTDYAQEELGDVVFVELPAVGSKVKHSEPFGVIESVKAVSDLYAPISGEVLEVNRALENEPELVNKDPHGRGWMIRLRPADSAEIESLLDALSYQKLVDELHA